MTRFYFPLPRFPFTFSLSHFPPFPSSLTLFASSLRLPCGGQSACDSYHHSPMNNSPPRKRAALIIILVLAAAPYFIRLGASSLWDSNEAFYAETPREMMESGDY